MHPQHNGLPHDTVTHAFPFHNAPDKERRAGQRILLVEDHSVNRQLALRQLAKLNWTADVAENGREAVDMVTRTAQPYALILMDCQMPEMDGFAATCAIRELERDGRPRTTIIAMTANALQSDREACLAAGVDDFLSKPVRSANLQHVLARWLSAVPPQAAAEEPRGAVIADALDAALVAELRALDPQSARIPGELIDAFLNDTREQIATLQAAVACTDMATVERAAHKLRGSSAQLGARALAVRCAELESLGRTRTTSGASTQLRAIEAELMRVEQALAAERQAR